MKIIGNGYLKQQPPTPQTTHHPTNTRHNHIQQTMYCLQYCITILCFPYARDIYK